MSRPYLGLHGPWQAACPKTEATEGWGNGQGEGVGSWTGYPCRTGKGAGCLLVLTGSCAFGLLLKQYGGRRWCFTWLRDVHVSPLWILLPWCKSPPVIFYKMTPASGKSLLWHPEEPSRDTTTEGCSKSTANTPGETWALWESREELCSLSQEPGCYS